MKYIDFLNMLKDDIYIIIHSQDFGPYEFIDAAVKELKEDENLYSWEVIKIVYESANVISINIKESKEES